LLGETLGDTDGLLEGLILTLGLTDGDFDGETLGEIEGETDVEGETEEDGLTEGEVEPPPPVAGIRAKPITPHAPEVIASAPPSIVVAVAIPAVTRAIVPSVPSVVP